MTKETGFCEICNDKPAELICGECRRNICHFCNAGEDDAPVCDNCDDEIWEDNYDE